MTIKEKELKRYSHWGVNGFISGKSDVLYTGTAEVTFSNENKNPHVSIIYIQPNGVMLGWWLQPNVKTSNTKITMDKMWRDLSKKSK